MKELKILFMTAIVLFVAHSTASAEIMRAEITAIDQNNRSITINQLDQSGVGVTRENLQLNLKGDTQFSGIRSLQELKVGDEVLLEARKRFFGPWEVKHLQSTKPGAKSAPQPPAQAQPQTQRTPMTGAQKSGVIKQSSSPVAASPQAVNEEAKQEGMTASATPKPRAQTKTSSPADIQR